MTYDVEKPECFIGGFVAGFLLMFVVAVVYAIPGHRDDVRNEAVRAGAARYVADEDGKPKFEWIDSRAKESKP